MVRHRGRAADVVQIEGSLSVVTGAGSGIGRATAFALSEGGSKVVVADIDEEAAAKTAADCGGIAYGVDVADRGSVMGLAATVIGDHGVPDIVVNNAGVGMCGSFLSSNLEDWDWIIGINLLGVVHGCHAFGPAMVARGSGQMVNVSSGLAYFPTPNESAYVTTKAGVLAFSQSLRAGWRTSGVGVSAICPGVIDTPIISQTKFSGEEAEPSQRRRTEKLFARGHPPEAVGNAIIRAVRRNRAVVPVGIEARIGWYLRLLPQPAQGFLARATSTSLSTGVPWRGRAEG